MINENLKLLEDNLRSYNIEVDEKMIHRFVEYRETLVEYNEFMNLTGITEEREVFIKHFLDSSYIFKSGYIQGGMSVIDVGTGAGFPGLPFKIVNPDIDLTLLDSLNKRINFLKEVGKRLGLEDIHYIHSRAEDGGKNKDYREKFDIATARAVASLPVLLELCVPFIRVDGRFICLKGPSVDEELEISKNAMKILGVILEERIEVRLPDEELRHNILVFKKIKPTTKKYPRKAGTPSKEPL